MSAFDATIRVGEASVAVLEDPQGKKTEAHLILGVLAVAPVGPGQAIPIPLGVLRVPVDKRSITQLRKELEQAEEQMEERSDIQIATSLDGVDQAAQKVQNLR
jgi:hypothetical protein